MILLARLRHDWICASGHMGEPPLYIVMHPANFKAWMLAMDEALDSLPAYQRFVPCQPRFKASSVFADESIPESGVLMIGATKHLLWMNV